VGEKTFQEPSFYLEFDDSTITSSGVNMDLKIISLVIAIFWPLAWSQLDSCASAVDCGKCTTIPDCVWCRETVSENVRENSCSSPINFLIYLEF
jgi:hypothetical protein